MRLVGIYRADDGAGDFSFGASRGAASPWWSADAGGQTDQSRFSRHDSP